MARQVLVWLAGNKGTDPRQATGLQAEDPPAGRGDVRPQHLSCKMRGHSAHTAGPHQPRLLCDQQDTLCQ